MGHTHPTRLRHTHTRQRKLQNHHHGEMNESPDEELWAMVAEEIARTIEAEWLATLEPAK